MTHAFALVRCCRIFNYIRPPAQEYIPFFRKCHNKLLYNEELRILFSAYSCRRGPDYPQAHLWLDCLLTGLAESCWVSEQLLKLSNSAKWALATCILATLTHSGHDPQAGTSAAESLMVTLELCIFIIPSKHFEFVSIASLCYHLNILMFMWMCQWADKHSL